MAPTNEHSARRRGTSVNTRRGRPYRNANTNAGVSRDYSSAPRDVHRRRDAHRRPARNPRPQAPANAPTGPRSSLASRMTFDNGRDPAPSSYGDSYRPRPQRVRPRLQDRVTDDRVYGGGAEATQGAHAHNVTATAVNDEYPEFDEFDKLVFATPETRNDTSSFRQASPLFCGSQPTQATDVPLPPSPVLPPTTFFPPLRSVLPATSSRPIRMFSAPVGGNNEAEAEVPATPKRPVNTYRGKDPIKKRVQNKKLQALLSDKPIPKERRKFHEERMELRVGVSKVTK